MADDNKCSLNNMLQSVMSVFNIEQNQLLPPSIYSAQYNAVSSLLLSELVKTYPLSQEHHDMLNPFIRFVKIPVRDGTVVLHKDYRNILGNPSISLKPDGSECNSPIIIDTEAEFKTQTLKRGCKTRPVVITPSSEWDYRTTSNYNYPTLTDPICKFIGENKNGEKLLQVCPYDISTVYILYAKQEEKYRYGYIMQPDDTYIFDINTTKESEWESNAFMPIFNALCSLYSAYSKDRELLEWTTLLSQKGIL